MLLDPFETNTERLFLLLLRIQRCNVICDVGSLNGSHARKFRRIRPGARIIAFEANPGNVEAMNADDELEEKRIELRAVAVGERDGWVPFHVVSGPTERQHMWSPLSSTRIRTDAPTKWWAELAVTPMRVEMTTLDSALVDTVDSTALWIDVEGGTFDVLVGARSVLDRVRLLHVEVEPVAIYAGQKTEQDVCQLLEKRGFELMAFGTGARQRDMVFLRRGDPWFAWVASVLVVTVVRILQPVWRTVRGWMVTGDSKV